jgi:hypothetical protein
MDAIKNPALSMTESLKNALAGTPISEQRQTTPLQPSSPVSTSVAGSTSHKRQSLYFHDFFHNGGLAMDAPCPMLIAVRAGIMTGLAWIGAQASSASTLNASNFSSSFQSNWTLEHDTIH